MLLWKKLTWTWQLGKGWTFVGTLMRWDTSENIITSVISHVRMWVDTLSIHISAQMSVCMRVCWCQRRHIYRNICQSISQTKSQGICQDYWQILYHRLCQHTWPHTGQHTRLQKCQSAAAVQKHSKITEANINKHSGSIIINNHLLAYCGWSWDQKISLKMTIK